MSKLYETYQLGTYRLQNHVAMAPMTRARNANLIANEQTALYYRQRAATGLIVSEGTPVSPEGQGYIAVPGIWSDEQVTGWKLVTNAVHEEGGVIFAQIWHVGRMSHTSLQPEHGAPVSSSNKAPAKSPKTMAFINNEDGTQGFADPSEPRALETDEVARVTQDFVKAAKNAIAAGFDGIEIHAANGYLFEQFINPVINDRCDQYGGTLENRIRFLLETVDAVSDAIGPDKVGIRLAPNNRVFDMPAYPESEATYLVIAQELSKRHLAYVHLNDNFSSGSSDISEAYLREFRKAYTGTLILAGRMTKERAESLIDEGVVDMAAFGQPFIANPDLVERLQKGLPLATPNRATYYGGGSEGYTDYPKASI
ncbi:alkene reductase [Dickeya sp. ws52]|uniref:alkene reductase n=1 Tax=Dickeya sp. ws52 TaxID=2576377 RepID=UPI00117FFB32|nr:alkene reductase [Dickeya sp. ws52]TYL41423.1 alkene reductase [Dickeya sp. ws52]